MNNEIKVSLSIILPGRVMYSQKQAKAFEKEKSSTGYDTFSMRVESFKSNKKDVETIIVKTRKSVPASQSLNINKESYDAMTDKENVPYWTKAGIWAGMSVKMRLEAHLRKICESLGGTSYTYQVFED